MKSNEQFEEIIKKLLIAGYVSFTSECPDADRQKFYRQSRIRREQEPLLWIGFKVRIKGDQVIGEFIQSEKLEVSTERPEVFESAPTQPRKPKFKLPKWLEARRAGFVEVQEKAAKLALENPAEYLGGWQDLDTLIFACDWLAELLEAGKDDPVLEKYVRSADRSMVDAVFLGEQTVERLDPIEIIRRQRDEIPVDDPSREHERLKLTERLEKLMLERDIRLQSVSPLD